MEKITSKYAVVTYEKGYTKIKLYDTTQEHPEIHPLHETLFENVTLTFNNNNMLTLIGEEWQYEVAFHDFYPSEIEDEVDQAYVDKTFFTKRDIIRSGWYRLKNNVRKELIITHYVIEKQLK